MPEDSRLFLWGSARLFKTTSKTPALGYCKKIQDYIKNSGFGAVQEDSRLHQELRLWGSTRRCKKYIKTSCFGAVQEDSKTTSKTLALRQCKKIEDYTENSGFEAMQIDSKATSFRNSSLRGQYKNIQRLHQKLRLWDSTRRSKTTSKTSALGQCTKMQRLGTSKPLALRKWKKIQYI